MSGVPLIDTPVTRGRLTDPSDRNGARNVKAERRSLDPESYCSGVVPLRARLEHWLRELVGDPARVETLLERHGSPVHVHRPDLLVRNLRRLEHAAERYDVPFEIFFARKANKCLSYVAQALRAGFGVDLASLEEAEQALSMGASPEHLVVTSAVKSKALFELCVQHGILVVLDNHDEIEAATSVAQALGRIARVGFRLSGFDLGSDVRPSRFGIPLADAGRAIEGLRETSRTEHRASGLRLETLHFHLDGYSADHRVKAIDQCLKLMDELWPNGGVRTLDIGGGLPMNYQADREQWRTYWREHRRALLDQRGEITYRNEGFGQLVWQGQILGSREAYPLHDFETAQQWLEAVLAARRPSAPSQSISTALRERGVRLACEPGRAALDGCGATLARVEHRKPLPSGASRGVRSTDSSSASPTWLVGVSMNGSQCRSKKSELFVDPLLIPKAEGRDATERIEGYLTGAYCTESDLLLHRRMCFPEGVAVGDSLVFPNTAGYLMHFTESRSHQFPLARNLVLEPLAPHERLDPIDL